MAGLFLVLALGQLEIYRFQLTAFLSIAVVFAVIGTNQGIFGDFSYQTALGAGWLLLAMVDVSTSSTCLQEAQKSDVSSLATGFLFRASPT